MKDEAIIRLMQRRPDKGIHEAICKYEGILTAVTSRILHSEQDVEECVSDTFVDVWRHIDSLRESGSLKGYLICTARNNAINRYRKNQRDLAVPQSHELDRLESGESLEDRVMDDTDIHTLLALIQEMEEPDREIMIRKHLLLESSGEIAQKLDLMPNQVKYKLQRSKAWLRDAMTQRGFAL